MDQITRLKTMESYLQKTSQTLQEVSEALEKYEKEEKDMYKLFNYYGSVQWMKDYEDDEAGKLPKNLKRGVLSEDAVYDLILMHKEMMAKMSKFVSKALKEI